MPVNSFIPSQRSTNAKTIVTAQPQTCPNDKHQPAVGPQHFMGYSSFLKADTHTYTHAHAHRYTHIVSNYILYLMLLFCR